ncbi:unnamed protein product, partial [marine sediment metagenome]
FGPINLGYSEAEVQQAVASALSKVDMAGYEQRSPHHLSLGEKKRIAIATILSMSPEVMVIDEPTSNLDPGLRLLEKYAVRMGGGRNHRFHLGDGILIKDNHLAVLYHLGMNLSDIVAKAKQNASPGIKVEVEVTTIQEALDAVAAGADIIMLDNMSPEEMARVVGVVKGQVEIEASGGITLDNIRQVAVTGVDIISIGALTHSVRALDISLEIEPETLKLL